MVSCIFFWFYFKKIILSGDFETNPGPQSKRCQEFSICHWNLSIATRSFIKFSLLKAYITIYNYHVIYLSETYLDSSILSDDNNLEIPGYDLIRPVPTRRRLCLLLKFITITNARHFLFAGMDYF